MSLTKIAMFVYTVILKPWPLRWITNKMLLLVIPSRVSLPEGVVNLHPKDPVISGALALGVYETYQLDLFRSLIRKGMTVLDIGANVGLYTVIAARLVGEEGRIISFEPEAQNFGILKKNISDNNFKNVQPIQVAVADTEGELTLFLSKGNKGKHSLFRPSDTGGEQVVKTIVLDKWLEKHTIGKVDIIKIDIQGAEPLAFSGMQKTLSTKPVLLMEYDPKSIRESGHNPIETLEMLLGYGYVLYSVDEGKKSKKKINDIRLFTDALRKEQYANLLCI